MRTIASFGVNDLTKPRSAGKVVNPHVVRHTAPPAPDYEKMREVAHPRKAQPEKQGDE
jgi:hypothetical protein